MTPADGDYFLLANTVNYVLHVSIYLFIVHALVVL